MRLPAWRWWWRLACRMYRSPEFGVASHREPTRFLIRWEVKER